MNGYIIKMEKSNWIFQSAICNGKTKEDSLELQTKNQQNNDTKALQTFAEGSGFIRNSLHWLIFAPSLSEMQGSVINDVELNYFDRLTINHFIFSNLTYQDY